jgi:hypothetical protein
MQVGELCKCFLRDRCFVAILQETTLVRARKLIAPPMEVRRGSTFQTNYDRRSMGNTVITLLEGVTQSAGDHSLPFNGTQYPAGVYYYTLSSDLYTTTGKLTLVK